MKKKEDLLFDVLMSLILVENSASMVKRKDFATDDRNAKRCYDAMRLAAKKASEFIVFYNGSEFLRQARNFDIVNENGERVINFRAFLDASAETATDYYYNVYLKFLRDLIKKISSFDPDTLSEFMEYVNKFEPSANVEIK